MSESNEIGFSKAPILSTETLRSRKSLGERIRELGINLPKKEPKTTIWASLYYVDLKIDNSCALNVLLLTPKLNLEKIIYYQPELILKNPSTGIKFYKIEKFESKMTTIRRISDIEVKSYKPTKRMKFRKKKRQSSLINQIIGILNKGKQPGIVREPSEESIEIEDEWHEEKDIHCLSEDIMQKIFVYFSPAERNLVLSRVCKSWYYILKDPFFWNELEFHKTNVSPDRIISLIKTYTSLKKLILNSVTNVVDILQELCRCNHSIEYLGIKNCKVSNQDFSRILLHVITCCLKLEVLDIKGMKFQSNRFSVTLNTINWRTDFSYKSSLRDFELDYETLFSHLLTQILEAVYKVRYFLLFSTSSNTKNRVTPPWLKTEKIQQLYCKLKDQLIELYFYRFYLELGRLKNLKTLNLSGNKLLTSQDLITVSINCRNLQELKFVDAVSDDQEGLKLRNEDLTFIISNLQNNLHTLKMDMYQLGNVSYMAILRCSRLKCLGLKNCLLLSSEVFRQFACLTSLKKLKITRAINLKPEDFQFVFETENLKNIEDLDINSCWGVGELGLEAITNRLRSLKCLSLKSCRSITGESLALLTRCPELTFLNIAHTNVDTNSLLYLSKYAKKLKRLVMDNNMTKKWITSQLTKTLPSLTITVSYSEFNKDERPL